MVLSAEYRHFVVIIVLCAGFLCDPAYAKANFGYGMELFTGGKYGESALIFEQCVNESPEDAEAYVLAAKSYEKLGDLTKVRTFYTKIVQKFPNTSYASNAIVLLQRIDKAQYVPENANCSPIVLPASTLVVDYGLDNRNLTIPVEINGKSWRLIFDTGANNSMIGKNHLRQLGIPEPNWPTTAYVVNVMGKNPVWKIFVDLSVGNQNWPNFRMYVTENMPTIYPSLGQNFIRQFNYLVDAQRKKLYFVKRGENKSFEDQLRDISYKIPFQKTNDDLMIVEALVNGVPCQMLIDIGASNMVFTRSELEQLGLTVPDNAVTQSTNTMVGKTEVKRMNLDSVQLGPILKNHVRTEIHFRASHNRPLIGLTFFKDISFYVDYDRCELLIFNLGTN